MSSIFLPLACVLLILACGGNSTDPGQAGAPDAVGVVGGQGQSARIETGLPAPLEVRVVDAAGRSVEGIAVTWSVAADGGSVTAASPTTDAGGVASAVWTLGTRSGPFRATATVSGLPAARFDATARPGPPEAMELVSGDDQEAVNGGAFPEPVVVRLRDAHGNPVDDALVDAAIVEGEGELLDAEVRTDAEGQAQVTWYAGDPAQDQRLRIEASALVLNVDGTALVPVPGTSYLSHRGFVEYIPGTLPFVVTAPHGGTLEPADIPDRTSGTTVTDLATDDVALRIGDALEDLLGARPHVVILHLRRIKLDANREIAEAAQGDPQAERAWHEFHRWTETAMAAVEEAHGTGFYVDIHGHGKHQAFELGYLLTGTDLQQDDAWLDGAVAIQKSSLRTLAEGSALPFSELVRGQASLGGLFEDEGYAVIPGPTQGAPDGPFFSGGYNAQRHGCRDGGIICGYQLELNRIGVRDSDANRQAFAEAHARVMESFFALHYGIQLELAAPSR